MDLTAVVPTMKVKGNKIIGLATERNVIVSSAQDILNVVKNSEYELAKEANAFILAPLQDHLLSHWLLVQFLKVKIIQLSDIGITKLFCGVPAIK